MHMCFILVLNYEVLSTITYYCKNTKYLFVLNGALHDNINNNGAKLIKIRMTTVNCQPNPSFPFKLLVFREYIFRMG